MLVLLLCIIAFVIVTVLQKRNNHILERCKNGKTFTETVEESLRREKTLKIIRYIICYTFLGLLAIFMLVPLVDYYFIKNCLRNRFSYTYMVSKKHSLGKLLLHF